VLAQLWTKRSFRALDLQLLEPLWELTGHPDPEASRSCAILTPEGPCMVLAETFRRGVLVAIHEDAGRVRPCGASPLLPCC
jgi:hypothetical protein